MAANTDSPHLGSRTRYKVHATYVYLCSEYMVYVLRGLEAKIETEFPQLNSDRRRKGKTE